MTIEEIERILQTIAGNQAQLTEEHIGYAARQARLDETLKQLTDAQIGNEARQVKLDEIVRQIAEAHKSLIELIGIQEERLDGHVIASQAPDEKMNALVDAQVGLEARQAKLEESYLLLVQLARIQDKRIDGHDEAPRQTDGKLDALIDAQMRLTERVDTLTRDIADAQIRLTQLVDTLNGRVDSIGEHLDQTVKQINALASAQARTDEQIKMLLDHDGVTKPGRRATKPAKKKATKKDPRS